MFKPFCLQFLDFLSEKLSKKWVILIVCKAVFRVLTFGEVAAADIPCAFLFAGHEWNCGHDHGANVPGGGPRLFMEIGETGTDGFVCLKPAAWCKKHQFWWCEGIVFTEFEHSVIEASFIGPVEAEMKVKHTLSGYPGMLQRFVFQSFLLFLQTQKH